MSVLASFTDGALPTLELPLYVIIILIGYYPHWILYIGLPILPKAESRFMFISPDEEDGWFEGTVRPVQM